jgi:putative flippase GtrA
LGVKTNGFAVGALSATVHPRPAPPDIHDPRTSGHVAPGPHIRMTASPMHRRVRHGLRRRHNWFQLVRFGFVGASGYVVNLAIYAVLLAFGVHYRGAATGGWVGGVLNNFWWNRHWTFAAGQGHAGFQAARFFVVSFIAFLVSLGVLTVLVEAGVPKLPAQALAIAAVTPLNFVGNKLWSFAR